MQKRTAILVLLLALVVSVSLAVAAGPRGGAKVGPGPGAGCPMAGVNGACPCPMMGQGIVKALGLSDAQVAETKALHKEFFDSTQQIRDQIKAKAKAMAALWAAEDPDVAAIKAAAAEIDALRAEMRDKGIDYLVKGLQVLTPQQREKLRTMIQNRPEWCPCPGCPMGMQGMGCGMGFGMGPGCGIGQGIGMGYGMGNATGPRARMGTCPLAK